MVKNEMKVAQPVSEQEYQLTQLLEHVTIEQCEDGKLRIANFPTIKDTLQAMTEDLSTNIVLTTEESTVDTARKVKKTLNTFIDDVKKSEDEVQTQIKPLLAQTKDLKKLAKNAVDKIDEGIREVYDLWIDDAITVHSRVCSFDVTKDMLNPDAFKRKMTKKSFYETVEMECIRLENEYAKEEEKRKAVISYCEKSGVPYEAVIHLVPTTELAQIFETVDGIQKRNKEREQAEAEFRQMKEAEIQEERKEIEEIQHQTFKHVPIMKDRWKIELIMDDNERALFKAFLTEHKIQIANQEYLGTVEA